MNQEGPSPIPEALRTDIRALRGLVEASNAADGLATEGEYAALLQHQLNAPLREDLSLVFANVGDAIPDNIQTFGELLRADDPPPGALSLVKDFAKMLEKDPNAYAGDVAAALYFLAIAAAEVRGENRITSLPDQKLREGYAWTRKRPWIPADLQQLIDKALD